MDKKKYLLPLLSIILSVGFLFGCNGNDTNNNNGNNGDNTGDQNQQEESIDQGITDQDSTDQDPTTEQQESLEDIPDVNSQKPLQ